MERLFQVLHFPVRDVYDLPQRGAVDDRMRCDLQHLQPVERLQQAAARDDDAVALDHDGGVGRAELPRGAGGVRVNLLIGQFLDIPQQDVALGDGAASVTAKAMACTGCACKMARMSGLQR